MSVSLHCTQATHYITANNIDSHVIDLRRSHKHLRLQYVQAEPSRSFCSCNLSDEAYNHIIHTCLDEVTSEYMAAAKQSIVDYVLKSPVEQRRLGLQALRPMLAQKAAAQSGKARVANWDLPEWWHKSAATAREEIAWTLQTLSANALELNELWIMQGFASRYLGQHAAKACYCHTSMLFCQNLSHDQAQVPTASA